MNDVNKHNKIEQKHTAQVKIKNKDNKYFNHVWWVPFISLLAVIYLTINHFITQGPLITIRFQTANGMEVKKTKLRYKDVIIGQVEKIVLNKDYRNVIVSVRLNKSSKGLLREHSQFWVVRPRISMTRISGLNTILSGPYIAIDPDINNKSNYKYDFDGLETPPVITQNKPGLRLTMLTTKASYINPGAAIYYKGMKVGNVDRVYFSTDHIWVKIDIFIDSPHDMLITPSTKFWTANSISINASTDGFNIEMEAMETLLTGGIVFDNPKNSQQKNSRVANGTEYLLHSSKKQAFEQNQGKKQYYVTYFKNSVKGLDIGAPVMIKGINIGKVKDIQLLFDEKAKQTNLSVLLEIYENRLKVINSVNVKTKRNIINKLVRNGIRARLETANLLTGTKYIILVQDKQHLKNVIKDTLTGYPVLPSAPESFDEITKGINKLITKFNQLELKEIVTNLNNLLTDGYLFTKDAKSTLKNLDSAVTKISKITAKTLSGFSPDAPIYYNLNNTIKELNKTLSSLRAIADMLERTPNALIFGEDK